MEPRLFQNGGRSMNGGRGYWTRLRGAAPFHSSHSNPPVDRHCSPTGPSGPGGTDATAHRSTAARKNSVRFCVQTLQGRDIPAASVFDPGSAGAEAGANWAILRQSRLVAKVGQVDTFLRLRHNGSQAGYNSDARPLRTDQQGGRWTTHALKLSTVPIIVVGGVTYSEFLLNIDLRSNRSGITLKDLQVFTSNNKFLWGCNANSNELGGKTAVFDRDGAGDVSVRRNGNLNTGSHKGDAVGLIPKAAFGGHKDVFVFTSFSGANAGAEEFGVRRGGAVTPPPPEPQAGSLSGAVVAEMNDNGSWEPQGAQADRVEEYVLSGVTVQLYSTNAAGELTYVTETATDGISNYTFSGLDAGKYVLVVVHPAGFIPGWVTEYTVDLAGGANGTGYNFGELPYIEAN